MYVRISICLPSHLPTYVHTWMHICICLCVCVYKRRYRLVRIGQATTKCDSMLRFVLRAFQGWALSTLKKIKHCRDTQTTQPSSHSSLPPLQIPQKSHRDREMLALKCMSPKSLKQAQTVEGPWQDIPATESPATLQTWPLPRCPLIETARCA